MNAGRDRHGRHGARRRPARTSGPCIIGNLEAFAGRRLTVNEEVYRSESETNTHNRAIVQLLKDYEVIKGDPDAGARSLHAPVLGERERARPGGDGRDAGQRRAQPADARAGRVAGDGGQGAGDHLDGGPVRDHAASGSTTSACPRRAAWAAASSPSCRAGSRSGRSRRRSTRPATACAASGRSQAIIKQLGGNLFASKPAGRARQTSAAVPSRCDRDGRRSQGAQPVTAPRCGRSIRSVALASALACRRAARWRAPALAQPTPPARHPTVRCW